MWDVLDDKFTVDQLDYLKKQRDYTKRELENNQRELNHLNKLIKDIETNGE